MTKDANNSQDLLNDAIREASAAPASAHRASAAPVAAAPGNDLRSVLNELSGVASAPGSKKSDASPGSAPHSSGSAGLNALIREVSGSGGNSAAPQAADARPSTARLGDGVHETQVDAAIASKPSTSNPRRLRLALRSLAVILMLVAAGFWWSTRPPPGLASTLQTLTQAVEKYRAGNNGALPKALATLEVFPKNAVEWPLRYWKARDAAGRSEIIWVPQSSGHYRILLRQGSEVWTVTDSDSKPKLALKGSP
jgi:hypothetical protein